jgi:ribonuclease-3
MNRIASIISSPELLSRALTHKSYHFENTDISSGHNERLEFLGDAVLSLVLTDSLIQRFPELTEGELSKIRASLVNETTLAEIAREMGLKDQIRLGKGEKSSGGSDKPRLLASTFEAVLGALYQDVQYEKTKTVVLDIFENSLKNLDLSTFFKADYKTRLQEMMQSKHRRVPNYELEKEEGPDHEKTFHVRLMMDEKIIATGMGRSKKQAEQDAARIAIDIFSKNVDEIKEDV